MGISRLRLVTWRNIDVRRHWTCPTLSPILSRMDKSPKPKRRWLWILLVPMLLLGIWMAPDVVRMKWRLWKQQEAVAIVEGLGGTLEDRIGKGDFPPPPEPPWLRALLGPEALPCIVGVRLSGPEVTDAEIENLEGLTELRSLILANTQVTDAGLKYLEGLTQIRQLSFYNTPITGVGLEILGGLPQLDSLYFNQAAVTDDGLKHIRGLTRLRCLILENTQVTDVGLQYLTGLAQLEDLRLDGTQITGPGLEHLRRMTATRHSV